MEEKSTTSDPGRYRGWGCLVRREGWSLTLRGKLLLLAAAGGLVLLAGWRIHSFLTLTRPVASDCLIVEGWIPDYALDEAVTEYRRGDYRLLLTSGSISNDSWNDPAPKYTSADWAAARLKKRGLANVVAIPNLAEGVDRTYHSALAVRRWIDRQPAAIPAVNVITVGAHARRTRLLFQKALGHATQVGVISVSDRNYDPDRWWDSTDGVRDVVNETFTYLYARLFFWPTAPTSTPSPSP